MDEGYYSHLPTRALERPLALVAFPGDEHHRAGHSLAARTGIPFVDVDRWVEHEAGQSLWELVDHLGEAAYRRLEAAQVRRALAALPASIIALGDGSLLDDGSRQSVLREATLVHLNRDLANAYWRLRELESTGSRPLHPFLSSPISDIDQLRPTFNARQQAYRQAHHVIDLESKNGGRIGRRLRELVEELSRPLR